jgi:hypothetical protein
MYGIKSHLYKKLKIFPRKGMKGKWRLPDLEVGLERGKIIGGEGQFSPIVVRTSSVKSPPQPDNPRNNIFN